MSAPAAKETRAIPQAIQQFGFVKVNVIGFLIKVKMVFLGLAA
jgi:hypothetical protein